MSQENEQTDNSVDTAAQPGSESVQSQEDALVPRKAYEDVAKDMHKYKAERRKLKAELEELHAAQDATRQAQLEEQQQFQKLYEEEKGKRAKLEESLNSAQAEYRNSTKKAALKARLGGIKEEYLAFADLSSIELGDDGLVDPDSLHAVENHFRQNYPELVPEAKNANITGKAAPINNGVSSNSPVDISQLSKAERIALLSQQIKVK